MFAVKKIVHKKNKSDNSSKQTFSHPKVLFENEKVMRSNFIHLTLTTYNHGNKKKSS